MRGQTREVRAIQAGVIGRVVQPETVKAAQPSAVGILQEMGTVISATIVLEPLL